MLAQSNFDPYYRWLAIPPEDQPPHHYRLLGLKPFENDLDVIETAADRQMGHLRHYQAGKNSALSQKLLNEVAAAKVCLLGAEKKRQYDELLRRQITADGGTSRQMAANRDTPAPQIQVQPIPPSQQASKNRGLLPSWISSPWLMLAVGVAMVAGLVMAIEWQGDKDGATGKGQPANRADTMVIPADAEKPRVAKAVKMQDDFDISVPLTPDQFQKLKPEQFATVEVHTNGTFEELRKGVSWEPEGRYCWMEIPSYLANMSFLRKHENKVVEATKFEILKSGVVLLAVTSRWGGGGGLSREQKETLTSQDELSAHGWNELGRIQHREGQDGLISGYHWLVHYRYCKKGEAFELCTEKYASPIIILPTGHPGKSPATPDESDLPEKQPADATDPKKSPEVPAELIVTDKESVIFAPDNPLVPENLRGGVTFRFTKKRKTDVRNGVVSFVVKQSGAVYLTANWDYQGNPSGGWTKERLTRRQLAANGWEDLGPCPWSKKNVLFRKFCRQGESYRLRVNKYRPPGLILPRGEGNPAKSDSAAEDSQP